MEGPLDPQPPAGCACPTTTDTAWPRSCGEAAAEDRIDIDELGERLESTYAARTYADLVPITVDLPVTAPGQPVVPRSRPAGPVLPAARHDASFAIMGGTSRKGVWEVGPTHTAFAVGRDQPGPA